MLEIPVEEMGPLSLQATAPQTVSSRCVVFAEGEILSFIHKDPPVPVPDVLAGVNQSIANGLWGMVQKVGVPSELLICGGVARNVGFVKAIEAHLGKPALVPPAAAVRAGPGRGRIRPPDRAGSWCVMLTMGIDIGSRSSKCVILEDGKLLTYGSIETGPNIVKTAQAVVEAAVQRRPANGASTACRCPT